MTLRQSAAKYSFGSAACPSARNCVFVPLPLKGGTIFRVETPEGYESLLRLLSDQPLTPMLGSLLGSRIQLVSSTSTLAEY